MKKPSFTRVNLSDVRIIIAIMHVPVVELLCQATTGRIPILKYLLSGVCGRMWPYHVMPGIRYHCFPRNQLQWCLPGTKSPREPGCVHNRGGGMRQTGLTGGEIQPAHGYRDRESTGADYSQV
jgi:hypothetical protein